MIGTIKRQRLELAHIDNDRVRGLLIYYTNNQAKMHKVCCIFLS